MAERKIGEIFTDITARLDPFERDLKRAEVMAQKSAQRIERRSRSRLGSINQALGFAGGALFALDKLSRVAEKASEAIVNFDRQLAFAGGNVGKATAATISGIFDENTILGRISESIASTIEAFAGVSPGRREELEITEEERRKAIRLEKLRAATERIKILNRELQLAQAITDEERRQLKLQFQKEDIQRRFNQNIQDSFAGTGLDLTVSDRLRDLEIALAEAQAANAGRKSTSSAAFTVQTPFGPFKTGDVEKDLKIQERQEKLLKDIRSILSNSQGNFIFVN